MVPGLSLQELGGWAPVAPVVAAAGILFIVLSFAEAGGRYREPGGLYRYSADAFGEYVGAQVGLLYWVVRATSAAAVANVFIVYFGEVWPSATQPTWRALLLTGVIGGSGFVNVRGSKQTGALLNSFAFAKLVPLAIVCTAGLFVLSPSSLMGLPLPGVRSWAHVILLWVFAFGGFESTLIAAGEARDPQRDGPRALLSALAIVTVTYVMVQLVVAGTVPTVASSRPVGEAARVVLGDLGAIIVAVCALFATSGGIGGSVLAASRVTFAIATRGGLPSIIGRVHPRFKTPDVSIVLFTLVVWVLALYGSFAWNASLSAIARLVVYATSAVAVLFLRRRGPSAFQPPVWIHVVALAFCVGLFAFQTLAEAVAVGVAIGAGSAIWVGYRAWRHYVKHDIHDESVVP